MKSKIKQLTLLFFSAFLTLGLAADEVSETTIRVEKIKDLNEINIETDQVTFLFRINKYDSQNSIFHSCMLNAGQYSQSFDHMVVGKEVSDIPFFHGGTGMAPSRNGYYEELILSDRGNHYLFYDPDREASRVQLRRDYGDSALVSVSFDRVFDGEKTVRFSEISDQRLFLIFYFDLNLNKIIDKGEFRRVVLRIN